MSIIAWLVIGLLAGALARLLVPGRDPMGLLATLVLGLVGSLVGAFLARVLFGDTDGVGLLGSTIGAVIVLLVWNAFTRSRRRGMSGFGRRVIS
jgi:uncharacterized membrane protein YeaQ/YmgE (transglycosylase-associated protein family)